MNGINQRNLQLASALAIVGIGECALVNFIPWEKYVDSGVAEAAPEQRV